MSDKHCQVGCCQTCGSLTFSQEWYDAFGVMLCNSCKKSEELITKFMRLQSCAKDDFLLTDGDLKSLGSISRSNPRKKDWSAMRLYMQRQCETVAVQKYGGLEGIEIHRTSLLSARQKKRVQKRLANQQQEVKEAKIHEDVKRKLDKIITGKDCRMREEVLDAEKGRCRVYDDGAEAEIEMI